MLNTDYADVITVEDCGDDLPPDFIEWLAALLLRETSDVGAED